MVRRSDVLRLVPLDRIAVPTLLLEQNDEWAELAKVPSAKPMECQRGGIPRDRLASNEHPTDNRRHFCERGTDSDRFRARLPGQASVHQRVLVADGGCNRLQCRAMSARVATHTRSRCAT